MRFPEVPVIATVADVSVTSFQTCSSREAAIPLASYTAPSSDSSTLLPFRSEMGMRRSDRSIFPFSIIQCGEDADLMNVLARLSDEFEGLPSALATSCE
jgi:hypothetical protein